MKRFFDTELEDFRSNIVLMGEKSVELVRLTLRALFEGDVALADEVLRRDDEVDQLEVQLDSEALRYITLRGPVATELRLLALGMKAGHDLERVGDEACSIAKRVKTLAGGMPPREFRHLPRMGEIVVEMLKDTLEGLLNEDDETARAVLQRDKEVDDLNRKNFKEYSALLTESPDETAGALELLFASKSLERIGDHATNIAEEVLYLLRGEDVRHTAESRRSPESRGDSGKA